MTLNIEKLNRWNIGSNCLLIACGGYFLAIGNKKFVVFARGMTEVNRENIGRKRFKGGFSIIKYLFVVGLGKGR